MPRLPFSPICKDNRFIVFFLTDKFKIVITVGGAKLNNGNTSNQVFADREISFPAASGTDSSGVSWTTSVSFIKDSSNANKDIPVGTVNVSYPEIGLDRTSVASKITSFEISWDDSTSRNITSGEYRATITVEVSKD